MFELVSELLGPTIHVFLPVLFEKVTWGEGVKGCVFVWERKTETEVFHALVFSLDGCGSQA